MMRHRGGQSSFGLQLGHFLISELIESKHKSRWRIGNNIKECVLCGKCQMVCPADAISVSAHNRTWTLNNMRCSQCLRCIVKCPARCLTQVRL